ncbi:hypothetical protein BGP34_31715, partial [Bacillus mycoides]
RAGVPRRHRQPALVLADPDVERVALVVVLRARRLLGFAGLFGDRIRPDGDAVVRVGLALRALGVEILILDRGRRAPDQHQRLGVVERALADLEAFVPQLDAVAVLDAGRRD